MGDKADELGRTLDADLGAISSTSRSFEASATEAVVTARSLAGLSDDLGMGGLSGDAATGRFQQIAGDIKSLAHYLDGLQAAADHAETAVQRAQKAYHALPDGELSLAERAALTAAGTVAMPGVGTVTAVVAGNILSDRREAAREKAAAQALSSLQGDLSGVRMPTMPVENFTPIEGGVDQPSGPGGPTGGPGTGGYDGTSSGGRSGGSGVRTIGTPTPTAPGPVDTSWHPPVGGGGGGGTPGGGTPGGSGGGGGGGHVSDPWTPGGGGSGGGGTTPGRGDGSSADGTVGGTLPGGGSGAGGGWTPGGHGGSGSGSSGSTIGGLGAGGLAGGLTVGGAALGGAGLSRIAGGGSGMPAGAAGLNFVGGAGGAGGSGGAGATLGGRPGGAGSALSGSTSSSLVQGSQTGAAGAGASGARSGGMLGAPMGGSGAAGSSGSRKRRTSDGLLAPDIDVEDGPEAPALGAAARAGGRDALHATPAPAADVVDDEW